MAKHQNDHKHTSISLLNNTWIYVNDILTVCRPNFLVYSFNMGNIIFVASYRSLSLGIKFYENNVTHVKTIQTLASMNYFLIRLYIKRQ
jgi:hypothetical protein